MAGVITLILIGLLRGVRTQRSLVFENLALRHQLAVLQRTARRPRLRTADRLLWVLLSRMWSGWMDAISVVQPATVIRWQRTGFKLVWTWKSRRNGPGRPAVALEVRALIRQMSTANPIWGAPRIHGELQKLGIEISQATVSKYVVRHRKPPSQTWRTFLENHLQTLVSVDFFVVPTVMFKVLFVFVVLARRRGTHRSPMKLLLVPDIYQIHQSGLDRFNNTKDLGELRIAEVFHASEAGVFHPNPGWHCKGLPVPRRPPACHRGYPHGPRSSRFRRVEAHERGRGAGPPRRRRVGRSRGRCGARRASRAARATSRLPLVARRRFPWRSR